jgi:hypothetical protein
VAWNEMRQVDFGVINKTVTYLKAITVYRCEKQEVVDVRLLILPSCVQKIPERAMMYCLRLCCACARTHTRYIYIYIYLFIYLFIY